MNKRALRIAIYIVINVVIICTSALLFWIEMSNKEDIWEGKHVYTWVILMLSVVLVHIIKALRLFIILYGTDIDVINFLSTYFKTTAVNIVFPFKLGDIFRAYCFGRCISNYMRGIVIILFDRFIDTAALVSLLAFLSFCAGTEMITFTWFLVWFILAIIILYFSGPGFCRFWKEFLLQRRSTVATLKSISILDVCERVFYEIKSTAKGRGLLLFILSLIAWLVDMIGVVALSGKSDMVKQMEDYLASIVRGNQATPYRRIVVLSYVLLMAFYLAMTMVKRIWRKDNRL